MKNTFFLLGSIQVFVALGALPSGILYLVDTSGALMGHTPALLANSPLTGFLIPGLFLLIIHGIGNLLCAYLSFKKEPIAGKWGLYMGVVLSVWILIQISWLGYISFLQPLLLFIGIAEILVSWRIYKKINLYPENQ